VIGPQNVGRDTPVNHKFHAAQHFDRILGMGQRKRLLILAPFLWSGAGSVITRLCEHFAGSWDVLLITSDRSKGFEDWPTYRDRVQQAGAQHRAIDLFCRDSISLWDSLGRVHEVCQEFKPHVIHAHAGVPTLAAVSARSLAPDSPLVIGQMYSWTPGRPGWMDQMDLAGFRQADCVVVSAQFYQTKLLDGGVSPDRIRLIPWGLPLGELDLARSRAVVSSKFPLIGFLGRIEPRKNQLVLIEAVKRLRSIHPNAHLVLLGPAGDPHYADQVKTIAADPEYRNWVDLKGFVEDPHAHVAGWDLFASASVDEGQGLAVQEAMYLKVPVVAAKAAGIEDYLCHGQTGWRVSQPNAEAMFQALKSVLETPSVLSKFGSQAHSLIKRHYNWEDTLRAFEDAYEQPPSTFRNSKK
jgi:glycosyltransferase involved in cell wall biosynthesis